MRQITQIKPLEAVRVDHERLGALYTQLGEASAEDVVCRAMEELALRLSHCDRLFRKSDWVELRKSARSLIAIADQIGMSDVSRVAGHVTECIDTEDDVALAATLQRLMRTGEGSLTAIWDSQDITI
ncbi:hypothetical protein ASD8599_03762 [Ascidiaceihabitans donghaensis]|jgi:hypothetical protein|uniref:HPt domain-containing protein n=1 Tax=Ascidiaceihabitans donghaensis TaxID=1510460 RepID=A0A2R8BIQ7_9RHOB|nr:hypothetical protein [Ascidiaceihabitans donghaensis]SPH23015.1 hypothetical protein ASD8599_03762 [Ascidiaceihabitans donghaensis]